ncbi:hypothetical protein PG985_000044 [Apiospora marii]|uniref:Uncharacterized protein n=1 Tax=Apiospora marii TaxID=335849 RepID=A0ABR1QZU8_9PEZI
MSMLKSRKRSSCQTPEDKWYEIWDILFPQVKRPETAYNLEANLRTPSITIPTPDFESLGNWWDPLADHLANRLREALLSSPGSLLNEKDPHLLRNHFANGLRDYPGRYPSIQSSGFTIEQPKMEDIDLPGLSHHGSNGSCLSISNSEGFSDGDNWMPRSTPSFSMPFYTYDTTLSRPRFMSIDWTNGSSVPRYVPGVIMEGPEVLQWEPPLLDTLNIGNEGMTPTDTDDWYDIEGYPEMWNFLNSDPLGSMKAEEADGDV